MTDETFTTTSFGPALKSNLNRGGSKFEPCLELRQHSTTSSDSSNENEEEKFKSSPESINSNTSMENTFFSFSCSQSLLSVSSSMFNEGSTKSNESFDSQPRKPPNDAARGKGAMHSSSDETSSKTITSKSSSVMR